MPMRTFRLYLYNQLVAFFPPTRLFAMKRSLLRWAGASVGDDVRITSSARFWLTGDLEIGSGSWIGHEVFVAGGNAAVYIGKDVDIAPRVSLITGTHKRGSSGKKAAGPGYSLPITIGDGAWIGACATIIGGVEIGEGALVAAGALVRTRVDARTSVGGVPAKKIRTSECQTPDVQP